MAQLSGVLHTYMDTVKREDILDEIMDVSPDDNPLTSTLGTEEVSATVHQWPEQYISRDTSTSASQQGDENSYADLTLPTMRDNLTQIIKKPFAVTETDIVVNKVSPKDAYARELGYAMRRLKNSMEFAVIRGSKVSGASGVAAVMSGFINQVAGIGSSSLRPSGTSLTETEFSSQMQLSWNATDSFVADLILVSGSLKADISLFTASNTRTVAATDARLVRAVNVWESDFGIHEIRAHKDMPSDGSVAAGHGLLMLRKELCKIGYLRNPKHVPNGITGDSKKGHVVTELTAIAHSSRSHVYKGGYRGGL